MKVSLPWLQKYFDQPLPKIAEVADALTFHVFEIDEIKGDMLDVKVLPDRASYGLSHRGIAKELSAILNIPLKSDPLREPIPALPTSTTLKVSVEDPSKCARYSAAKITGVKIGPSPAWLTAALESVGQRSINNVVDATNFVLLNIGQPLHAFDATKVRSITVRSSTEGEKMTALGGTEYVLPAGTLVIADGDHVLGIAGVKGGTKAEITESTTDIIIETANFDGAQIRKTAQALKLFTDASLRFQNKISPELAAYGMRDVLALIADVAGGTLEGVVDLYPKRSTWQYRVGVSSREVSDLLGAPYTDAQVTDAFTRLGLPFDCVDVEQVIRSHIDECLDKPFQLHTSMRTDAPRVFSCSSLISYLFTFAGIWMPSLSVDKFVFSTPIPKDELRFGDFLFFSTPTSHVWYESQEYLPGTPVPQGISHLGMYLGDGTFIHAHGGDDQKVLISDMASYPHMDTFVGYGRVIKNLAEKRFVVQVPFERNDIKIKEDLIEEVGRIIGYDNVDPVVLPSTAGVPELNRFYGIEKIKDFLTEHGFTEVSTQSFAKKGDVLLANPLDIDRPYLRTELSANMAAALEQGKHIAPLITKPKEKIKLFEIGTVFDGTQEHLSLVVSEALSELDVELGLKPAMKAAIAEYDVSKFDLSAYGKGYMPKRYALSMYKPFSIYPFVTRDIALWVPDGISADAVLSKIVASAGPLLIRSDIFDTFAKDGRTSYAFRLVFQSLERTLSDVDVNEWMAKVGESVKAEGWEVR